MDDAGSAYSLSRLIGYLLIGVVAALAVALVQQRRGRPGLVMPLVVGTVVTVAAMFTSVLGNGEEPVALGLLLRRPAS
jgi:uncharacterized membrane protein YeaQ/YmgE (transglycosylase-associated protein family)